MRPAAIAAPTRDQDHPAEKLSPLSGPRADLRAQLQADQRHRDADAADDGSGDGQADVELARANPTAKFDRPTDTATRIRASI
jgi:hypothetical protein